MTPEQTSVHVRGGRKNTATGLCILCSCWFRFSGRTNIDVWFENECCAPLFSGAHIKRWRPQHPSFPLWSWRALSATELQPHQTSRMTVVSMVIKSFCLALFKQAPLVASGHTKQIPSHGTVLPFSTPIVMPWSMKWAVKHTYSKVEKHSQVMFLFASLLLDGTKLQPPITLFVRG